MATKRQRENGTWEFAFQKKGVLDRIYVTFDTLEEGLEYAQKAEELLSRGVIPVELQKDGLRTVWRLLEAYAEATKLKESDVKLLPTLMRQLDGVKLDAVTYSWVERWVAKMTPELAPSTLKKRVGLLARACDWGLRRGLLNWPNNPLRLLPRGYASAERGEAWLGERDRRLEVTEEGAIRKALVKKEERLMFDMALETAMRMREMFTLTMGQIDLKRRTIFLDKTKNGDKRQVPITSVLLKLLEPVVTKEADKLLFGFWDGVEDKAACTNRLSKLYSDRFAKAGVKDFRFHDLRHEATSRFFERTKLTDVQISKITGHKDPRMLRRYANLRASELSTQLW